MLSLPPSVRVFVATHPVDGRKGADSLLAMIRSVFEHDPLTGHLYVFFSRRRDRVRGLAQLRGQANTRAAVVVPPVGVDEARLQLLLQHSPRPVGATAQLYDGAKGDARGGTVLG